MAFLTRTAGGARPDLPWGLDQWFYAIPYGIFSYLICKEIPFVNEYVGALLAYTGAFLGKRWGHGDYMALPYSPTKGPGTEWGDFIVRLFFGPDPRLSGDEAEANTIRIQMYGPTKLKYRNYMGLSLSGLFPALITVILLLLGGYIGWAILLAVFSIAKSVAYIIGWEIFPTGRASYYEKPNNTNYNYWKHEFMEATQIGEWLTGIFAGLGLTICFMAIF